MRGRAAPCVVLLSHDSGPGLPAGDEAPTSRLGSGPLPSGGPPHDGSPLVLGEITRASTIALQLCCDPSPAYADLLGQAAGVLPPPRRRGSRIGRGCRPRPSPTALRTVSFDFPWEHQRPYFRTQVENFVGLGPATFSPHPAGELFRHHGSLQLGQDCSDHFAVVHQPGGWQGGCGWPAAGPLVRRVRTPSV